jgi:hypothetical protein
MLVGAKIVAQQFGDASTSISQMEGIMGIGWGKNVDTNYSNIIDQLAAQGVTRSRAFSLNLASIDVAQGTSLELPVRITRAHLSRYDYLWRCRYDEV